MRSKTHPQGLLSLTTKEQQVLATSNKLMGRVLHMMEKCAALDIAFSMENPISSSMWHLPAVAKFFKERGCKEVIYDSCCYGTPYKKRTRLLVSGDFLNKLQMNCTCAPGTHVVLSGWKDLKNPNRVNLPTKKGSAAYSEALCKKWAGLVQQHIKDTHVT